MFSVKTQKVYCIHCNQKVQLPLENNCSYCNKSWKHTDEEIDIENEKVRQRIEQKADPKYWDEKLVDKIDNLIINTEFITCSGIPQKTIIKTKWLVREFEKLKVKMDNMECII